MTQCFGCWTQCGVRVRVDTEQGKVLRIAGNPYHPLSHEHHIDASVPFTTAMEQLAGSQVLTHVLPPAPVVQLYSKVCTARYVFWSR
jgi:hypothetical protein